MKKLILFLCLIGFVSKANAQFDFNPNDIIDKLVGPLYSDRPGNCLSAHTPGILAIQVQTGFNYGRRDFSLNQHQRWIGVPTQLRLGLTKKLEINTSFTYSDYLYEGPWPPAIRLGGFTSPDLGLRYAFMEGDGWKPFMAAQANMSFPSHSGDWQQQQFGSSYYLITSNQWDVLSINTTLGLHMNGSGNFAPTYPWVLNVGFKLSDKWFAYAEGFGNFVGLSLSADAGIAFSPINDLQFDLFGGLNNVNSSWDSWFAEAGVSYRFSFMKMIAKKKAKELMNGLFGS